jgi:hypothetical protein
MAVMSRKKRAVAQGWNAINKQRDEASKTPEKEETTQKVSEEEHQKRLKILKDLGLVK